MNLDERILQMLFSRSRARAAAFSAAAALMLVPANLLPVITMEVPGRSRTDTILSSIIGLYDQGLWPLAAIVFTASFLVPLLKLFGLGWLLHASRRPPVRHAPGLTRLYATLDFIGRWSMLDVFLVAFLAGAVRFGILVSVHPRPGIIAFAAAVVLTMLATAAFDPKLLWVTTAAEERVLSP